MKKMTIRIDRKQFTDKESGRERLVFRDARLQLNNGECVAIVGPSGCGKSTLLHIVAGPDQSYRGEIKWDWSGNQRSHRLGYVFQNPRLLPWLRVRRNIELVMEKPASDSTLVD
ncbi:MAG: ATP-binding cassette domain-containing protein [Gammaproteobacteria bacterium]|nr:ATP-binding cassette domain-containing protein [Gammaproteobacteria bacterium]MCP5416371.1 ATP-binding cassette domain-containing protein [Chromatiaceae bacterium]